MVEGGEFSARGIFVGAKDIFHGWYFLGERSRPKHWPHLRCVLISF
jgi:hypothetical protein